MQANGATTPKVINRKPIRANATRRSTALTGMFAVTTRLLSQLANRTFRHHACLMLRLSNQLAISVTA